MTVWRWSLISLLVACTPTVELENCDQPQLVSLPAMSELCDRGNDSPTLGANRLGVMQLMLQGRTEEAIDQCLNEYEMLGQLDHEEIRHICLHVLQTSAHGDPNEQALAIFGAGISTHERLLPLLIEASRSPIPQAQLAALQFLAQYQDQRADRAINRAMGSRYLPIRLEAVYHLTRKRYPTAHGQIDALMAKVPPPMQALFPQLFARLGDPESLSRLRHALMSSDTHLRIAAILAVGQHRRDSLLPELRSLSKQVNPAQREACATALGLFEDEASVPVLESYLQSNHPNVRLAAETALYRMGREQYRREIELQAVDSNLFALTTLSEMPGSEDFLADMCRSQDLQTRINAGITLLALKDARCLPVIYELLLSDSRDLALVPHSSASHSLVAWRVIPSAQHNFGKQPNAYLMSERQKDAILTACMDLPDQDFLELSEALLARQELARIPLLVRLMENEQSPEAIALLKKYAECPGAPLTRQACQLALFRMDEPGGYEQQVQAWAMEQAHASLINLNPVLPWELHHQDDPYELTPDEGSRLLFDTLEALAISQDPEHLAILLEIMKEGDPSNRPAIAGLLLRATL